VSLATERGAGGKILVTWLGYDPDGEQTGRRLRDAGFELVLAPRTGERTPDELAALAQDAVGALVSTDPFDAGVLARCPRLRVISRVGVGYDSIDVDAATRHGVAVTICPGGNEDAVADHTVALMLAAVRRIGENDASVRAGRWDRAGRLTPWELTGSVVGLVGYGAIGRAVARRLRGFGVQLLVADPQADVEPDVERVSLDELLARADVVSLHAPLTADTECLIGEAALARMRPSAVLVNTSRGRLVDEAALARALGEQRIRGAALDVFQREPPGATSELLDLANVVLSPHIAGLSIASLASMTTQATTSVLDVLAGRTPVGLVNADGIDAGKLARQASS
jgi:phosphoglycerate dehydrogenase-like enzyme